MAQIRSGRSEVCPSRFSYKCVRFRSGSPAGATRSSTCTTWTASQGTSSRARARSMSHGVRPPLSAMTKPPRAATAALASCATIAAASRATEPASANIRTFITASPAVGAVYDRPRCRNLDTVGGHRPPLQFESSGLADRSNRLRARHWIAPASLGRHSLDLTRSPGICFVLVYRSFRFQHWIDDAPRLFNVILTREQGSVSFHRSSQHPFISIHITGARRTARHHFSRLDGHLLARRQHHNPHSDCGFRTEPEPKMVLCQSTGRYQRGRFAEPANNFGARHGQTLPSSNVERNSFPAPGIDLQPQGGKGLSLRTLRYSPLVAVAAELAAHQLLLIDWGNRLQYLDLLIADAFTVGSDWRLHRQIRQNLKQMVLNRVTNSAGLIVESSSALDAEIFGHRDLHVLDIVAVPERLDKRVCEAKDQQVVHWPLPQVVVNAKDICFVKGAEQDQIQFPCR